MTRNLEIAKVYLRTRMRKERPELLPMLADVLALVELATRKPEPITVPRLSRPFAPTEFAGRSVRGDTLPATLMGPL